jgi:DNA repair exonuclease SbcCD nuclease subunit
MRLGLLADLHLGETRRAQWNNEMLLDSAERLTREGVRILNDRKPDLVVALGDLTTTGTPQQLRQARVLLEELQVPWYALPGNHERSAVEKGDFDRAFSGHVPPLYAPRGEWGLAFVREQLPVDSEDTYSLGEAQIEEIVEKATVHNPRGVVIFSHVMLLSEEGFAHQRGGRYPGHAADGAALMERLSQLTVYRPVALCGHAHWNLVTVEDCGVQVTTASVVEYPLEGRVVELRPYQLSYEVFATGSPDDRMESLAGAGWAAGQPDDRVGEVSLSWG